MDKVNICGTNIDNLTMSEAIARIEQFILARRPRYVVTPNVDVVVHLHKDADFKRIYPEASLTVCDGMPLVWASRFLKRPLKEKISGSDLFPHLCKLAADKGYCLFFLGGRDGSVERTAQTLKKICPTIKIGGLYCPPLGFEREPREMQKIIRMIRNARPDVLFVGLGSPKQEKWIHKYINEYKVPVSIGIGGTFDLFAGFFRRAPVKLQNAGLEWLWRLMIEPGRLWKRYLVNDPVFFWLVLKQKMGWMK